MGLPADDPSYALFYKLCIEANVRRTRRAASDLTQTLRTLAAAPTSMSVQQPQAMPPGPDIAAPSSPPTRVEPQRLRIGSGYVGSV